MPCCCTTGRAHMSLLLNMFQPHTFPTSFGRTTKSQFWPIRHWGGEALPNHSYRNICKTRETHKEGYSEEVMDEKGKYAKLRPESCARNTGKAKKRRIQKKTLKERVAYSQDRSQYFCGVEVGRPDVEPECKYYTAVVMRIQLTKQHH